MAIEISEFGEPKRRYGQQLPVLPLPPVRTTQVAAGAAAFQLQAGTALVAILPDVAVRVGVGADSGAAGTAAGAVASSVLLQAGVVRHFEVAGGQWIKVVAA